MGKQATRKAKQTTELATIDTSIFAEDAGAGVDDLGTDDLSIPFLKILQKMSDELDSLPDAKAGDIYNTVTKVCVRGAVQVINCAYNLVFVEWEPRGTGSGAPYKIYGPADVIPETEIGDDNRDMVVGGSGRYLERTAQHYVLIVDEEGGTQQALLPMKATQFKKSKGWNSAMRASKMKRPDGSFFTPPRFSHMWSLESVPEENRNGSWHGWKITKLEAIEDINLYREAKHFAESIATGGVTVKHEQEGGSAGKAPPVSDTGPLVDDEDIPF